VSTLVYLERCWPLFFTLKTFNSILYFRSLH
jgi:hypothetical protein